MIWCKRVETNSTARAKAEADPQALLGIVSTVVKATTRETVLLLAKSVKSVVMTTTLNQSVKVVLTNVIQSRHRPKQKGKGKKFHEINEQNDGVMDDLAKQVQSLFYSDVHFNAVNTRITRMHTSIKCETSDGWSSDQTFKIDTGANGNLMPISMFT